MTLADGIVYRKFCGSMITDKHVAFLGTSRSGLGHLRRIANIATCMSKRAPRLRMSLISNASPAGLDSSELAAFGDVSVCKRSDMAALLSGSNVHLAVLDTLQVSGIESYRGLAALVLRETPQQCLNGFRRADDRPWDCVILPNPPEHWMPLIGKDFSHSVTAAGWILRPTGVRGLHEQSAGIVLATGGGGTPETRRQLYPLLKEVIGKARSLARHGFHVRQALGPRAGADALPCVDEVFDPRGDLNVVFRAADLVISTAGYNSVLELASTDTPTMLVSIPRSLDDQAKRVSHWGPRLGFGLTPQTVDEAAQWLAHKSDKPVRRRPLDLGQNGAERAAELLLAML